MTFQCPHSVNPFHKILIHNNKPHIPPPFFPEEWLLVDKLATSNTSFAWVERKRPIHHIILFWTWIFFPLFLLQIGGFCGPHAEDWLMNCYCIRLFLNVKFLNIPFLLSCRIHVLSSNCEDPFQGQGREPFLLPVSLPLESSSDNSACQHPSVTPVISP